MPSFVLARRRQPEQQALTTRGRSAITGGILDAFDARCPFTLTAGRVDRTPQAETSPGDPMPSFSRAGRLRQDRRRAASDARRRRLGPGGTARPTEVLAQQHHRSITRMLGDLAAGGSSAAPTKARGGPADRQHVDRRAARRPARIASGQAGIVIGTHALLQDTVQFADLALVVVDEQHRFGVEQRDSCALRGPSRRIVLVMTATPIPRTVAMTVFGDPRPRPCVSSRRPSTHHQSRRSRMEGLVPAHLGARRRRGAARPAGLCRLSTDGGRCRRQRRPRRGRHRRVRPSITRRRSRRATRGPMPTTGTVRAPGEGDDPEPPGDIEVEEDRLPRPSTVSSRLWRSCRPSPRSPGCGWRCPRPDAVGGQGLNDAWPCGRRGRCARLDHGHRGRRRCTTQA